MEEQNAKKILDALYNGDFSGDFMWKYFDNFKNIPQSKWPQLVVRYAIEEVASRIQYTY